MLIVSSIPQERCIVRNKVILPDQSRVVHVSLQGLGGLVPFLPPMLNARFYVCDNHAKQYATEIARIFKVKPGVMPPVFFY